MYINTLFLQNSIIVACKSAALCAYFSKIISVDNTKLMNLIILTILDQHVFYTKNNTLLIATFALTIVVIVYIADNIVVTVL